MKKKLITNFISVKSNLSISKKASRIFFRTKLIYIKKTDKKIATADYILMHYFTIFKYIGTKFPLSILIKYLCSVILKVHNHSNLINIIIELYEFQR